MERPRTMRIRPALTLIALASAVGSWTRQGGAHDEEPRHADPTGAKAAVAEVLHCPLAFAGVHLQKDRPANSRVAYH
jgi:hypothetical protein